MSADEITRPLLLLFDIDGTLLAGATDAHRDALHAALLAVHGVDAQTVNARLRPAGRTDGEIARTILLAAGVSAERIDERAGAVREECCRAYQRLCPKDLSRTVLPGVRELLAWLAGRADVRLALVTGNYELVARLKLASAGIGHRFPSGQGGFGSDAEDRAALPAIARRRAGTVGAPHPRAATTVIGDTPRDIACAHADGVRCIALATGPFGREELFQADAVLPSALELRKLLAAELAA
ncbi:MAG: haloacid dehalogenase-like hydrolase [Solirubrobacterales bacterium]|nr:haloacid dehalogenase-like hydrolase [Solirubrobacterales bacterium]